MSTNGVARFRCGARRRFILRGLSPDQIVHGRFQRHAGRLFAEMVGREADRIGHGPAVGGKLTIVKGAPALVPAFYALLPLPTFSFSLVSKNFRSPRTFILASHE